MDGTTLTQLIGSLGFPIVACIAMYYRMIKEDEQHKEEMNTMRDAINNNTVALTKLTDRLEARNG